ncbi:MAG: C39 family peptidase [Clostridia bacterium]|nr:C39 family peptidase [Clostridia bacterium]
MKRRRKGKYTYGCLIMLPYIIMVALLITVMFSLARCVGKNIDAPNTRTNSSQCDSLDANAIIEEFAKNNNLQTNEWPDELVELLDKNPETKSFVLNYPFKKDEKFKIDLSEYKNSKKVPLFMQWDERWGYSRYAGDLMGLTGCGPTCLSMVSVYLLNDTKYTPKYVADFSERNGYSVSGNGSSWSLISKGGKKLGLDVIEIPLDENRIIKNLKVGNPIICIMGPGDFTTTGHFIVMTEYVDGKIKVNDPNSKTRSEKLWNLPDIKNQIRNLWVCRK